MLLATGQIIYQKISAGLLKANFCTFNFLIYNTSSDYMFAAGLSVQHNCLQPKNILAFWSYDAGDYKSVSACK